jgi:sugar phosphate permease
MTPLGFSLIHRWFPEKNRATANSIFYGSQYLGSAISSLNLIAAEDFGWREDYILMGTLGVVAGFIGLLGLREVEKEC